MSQVLWSGWIQAEKEVSYDVIQYMGASLNGGTPKHPKMITFSGKTQ